MIRNCTNNTNQILYPEFNVDCDFNPPTEIETFFIDSMKTPLYKLSTATNGKLYTFDLNLFIGTLESEEDFFSRSGLSIRVRDNDALIKNLTPYNGLSFGIEMMRYFFWDCFCAHKFSLTPDDYLNFSELTKNALAKAFDEVINSQPMYEPIKEQTESDNTNVTGKKRTATQVGLDEPTQNQKRVKSDEIVNTLLSQYNSNVHRYSCQDPTPFLGGSGQPVGGTPLLIPEEIDVMNDISANLSPPLSYCLKNQYSTETRNQLVERFKQRNRNLDLNLGFTDFLPSRIENCLTQCILFKIFKLDEETNQTRSVQSLKKLIQELDQKQSAKMQIAALISDKEISLPDLFNLVSSTILNYFPEKSLRDNYLSVTGVVHLLVKIALLRSGILRNPSE